MIQAITQDLAEVVFCQMLSKEDRIVNPLRQSANVIFNHWRAYINFPGTSLVDEYFQAEIKLIKCDSDSTFAFSDQIETYGDWSVERIGKVQRVFLACQGPSFLEVTRICLSTGKQLEMRSVEFKSRI